MKFTCLAKHNDTIEVLVSGVSKNRALASVSENAELNLKQDSYDHYYDEKTQTSYYIIRDEDAILLL